VAPNKQENTHVCTERGSNPWIRYRFLVHKRFTSAVKRVESVSDRMSYIILRGCFCHVILLNIHASREDKIDDVKASFYAELKSVFDKFQK
jgi:hypothetical protein